MKAFWMSATGQLSAGLVLVAAVVAAFAAGGDPAFGLAHFFETTVEQIFHPDSKEIPT